MVGLTDQIIGAESSGQPALIGSRCEPVHRQYLAADTEQLLRRLGVRLSDFNRFLAACEI